jgi:hypothetical protein
LALFAVGSLIGKVVEVDMEFTRERSIVRMLVDVTRPELISKTTVDHVYEGDGYGLLFKAENGSGDVDDDTDMDEAPSDDKNDNQDEHKESDENNFDDTKKNQNSSSGATEPKQPELSGSKNKVSAPAQVHFGTMDISPCMPLEGSLSEGRLRVFLPHKLWGDRDEEEGLPSPLSEPNVGFHTPGGRNVWTADGPISYTAAEKSASFGAATGGSPTLVCDSKSISDSMFSKSLYHANQHKVDVHEDVFLQDQEKIKECDKVHCISPVQVNPISPSVSENISNDVSSCSLVNNNYIPQLSHEKVDKVEAGFLQGNVTVSESEPLSCSKMSPQVGTCVAPISPVSSASGLSMRFQPKSSCCEYQAFTGFTCLCRGRFFAWLCCCRCLCSCHGCFAWLCCCRCLCSCRGRFFAPFCCRGNGDLCVCSCRGGLFARFCYRDSSEHCCYIQSCHHSGRLWL